MNARARTAYWAVVAAVTYLALCVLDACTRGDLGNLFAPGLAATVGLIGLAAEPRKDRP